MEGAFLQAIGLLRDVVSHWDESAVAKYNLSESFDELVERLAGGIEFRQDGVNHD